MVLSEGKLESTIRILEHYNDIVERIRKKGGGRYSEGVATASGKYASNSAAYDGARGAAASLPRGLKGSETNLARVKAVVGALRAVKAGK